jgi:hypothetical protein
MEVEQIYVWLYTSSDLNNDHHVTVVFIDTCEPRYALHITHVQ